MYSTAEKEAQALALLEAAAAPELHSQLQRYARTLTGHAEDAADLVQEALLGAHDLAQRKGFAPRTPNELKYYLLRCIKNEYVDEQRRRGKHVELAPGVGEAEEVATVDTRAHLASEVERVLREQYSPADRVVVRLAAEGYSVRKIDQMTGRGYRTVARLLEHMRAFVTGQLSPE